jgi:hypothetical protein
MADNVHGEILDVSANMENFCLIRRRGPGVFDVRNPVGESFVDGCFETIDFFAGLLRFEC